MWLSFTTDKFAAPPAGAPIHSKDRPDGMLLVPSLSFPFFNFLLAAHVIEDVCGFCTHGLCKSHFGFWYFHPRTLVPAHHCLFHLSPPTHSPILRAVRYLNHELYTALIHHGFQPRSNRSASVGSLQEAYTRQTSSSSSSSSSSSYSSSSASSLLGDSEWTMEQKAALLCAALRELFHRLDGSYACVALIKGIGMVGATGTKTTDKKKKEEEKEEEEEEEGKKAGGKREKKIMKEKCVRSCMVRVLYIYATLCFTN